MCTVARDYANAKLYGAEQCKNYLKDLQQWVREQVQYTNKGQCGIDVSCFKYDPCTSFIPSQISCSVSITETTTCSITITDIS